MNIKTSVNLLELLLQDRKDNLDGKEPDEKIKMTIKALINEDINDAYRTLLYQYKDVPVVREIIGETCGSYYKYIKQNQHRKGIPSVGISALLKYEDIPQVRELIEKNISEITEELRKDIEYTYEFIFPESMHIKEIRELFYMQLSAVSSLLKSYSVGPSSDIISKYGEEMGELIASNEDILDELCERNFIEFMIGIMGCWHINALRPIIKDNMKLYLKPLCDFIKSKSSLGMDLSDYKMYDISIDTIERLKKYLEYDMFDDDQRKIVEEVVNYEYQA